MRIPGTASARRFNGMTAPTLRARSFSILFLAATLALAPSAADAELRVWGTDDPGDAADEPSDDPGDPWVETDGSFEIPVALAPGEELFLASRNDQDPGRNKFWNVRLEGPVLVNLLPRNGNSWFDGYQTADDTTPVGKQFISLTNGVNFRQWQLAFSPQPRWERIRLWAPAGANGQLKVRASSFCTDLQFAPVDILFADTSIDSPTGVRGAPLYTEFWVFPTTTPADSEVLPTITAPPPTGVWSSEFVSVDPEGNPRPLGVRFFTPGPGLTPSDQFTAGFTMDGPADLAYAVFTFDAVSGTYTPFDVDASPPALPTLASPWAYAALAIALITGAIVMTRARRTAIGRT